MSSKKNFVAVLAIILLAVLGIWLTKSKKISLQRYSPEAQQRLSNMPSLFVPEEKKSQAYTQDPGEFRLETLRNETIQPGASFILEKPFVDTVKEYTEKARGNSFRLLPGSGTTETKSTFHLAREGLYLYLVIEKISDSQTRVSVFNSSINK
jgi:hypothetical protein